MPEPFQEVGPPARGEGGDPGHPSQGLVVGILADVQARDLGDAHARLAAGSGYILMVIAANHPAVAFYRKHGLVDEAHVDGPSYMHERMGVAFPPGTAPVPALVLRFTKPT